MQESVPKLVRKLINAKLVQFYSKELYSAVSDSKDTKLMIQIIYDIKFLAALIQNADDYISSSSRHSNMSEQDAFLSSVVPLYEQKVDPFDYDVYLQHMSEKLSAEVSQNQHIYGSIVGSSKSLSSSAASSASSSFAPTKATTYHNLSQLVLTPTKFQPLSVPSSAATFGLKRNSNLVNMSNAREAAASEHQPGFLPPEVKNLNWFNDAQ